VSSEDSTHSYNTVMREDLVSAVLGERGVAHASPAHGHGHGLGHGHAHAPPVVVDGSLARADGDPRDARLLDDSSSHRTAARRISISLTPRYNTLPPSLPLVIAATTLSPRAVRRPRAALVRGASSVRVGGMHAAPTIVTGVRTLRRVRIPWNALWLPGSVVGTRGWPLQPQPI